MISKEIRALVWSMLLVVGGAAVLDAQNHRGVIRGRVQDASGAVVVGAAVTAVNEATNETRATTSGDAGAFALAELAPGPWRVEIGAPGHKTQVQRVVLAVNQDRRADAQLQVGALTERVEVSAPVADVRRDSPAVGTVVENRQILDMPLDGRNFSSSRCSRRAPCLRLKVRQDRCAAIFRSASTADVKTSTAFFSTAPTTSIRSSTRRACARRSTRFGNSKCSRARPTPRTAARPRRKSVW